MSQSVSQGKERLREKGISGQDPGLKAPVPSAPLSGLGSGPAGFDGGADAAAGTKHSMHDCPNRVAGLDHVLKHLIDDIFLEDAEIAVTEEILLEGLQFEAALAGHVADCEGAEIGQAGLGTYGCKFGVVDLDFIAGKLVLPGFDGGKGEIDAGFGVVVRIAWFDSHTSYCTRVKFRPDGLCQSHFSAPSGQLIESYILALVN